MGNYPENEFLSLSALQHLLFCRRQCALIHIEQLWVENLFTAEGRVMHERVDRGDRVDKGQVKISYGLPLKSARLGISGIADAVEFHRHKGSKGTWIPFPVEYKRGKPKKNLSDKVQLCAQALCLEEMLNLKVGKGALFYGKTRRRLDVDFDANLRRQTEKTCEKLHAMVASGKTPRPLYGKKCDTCSFLNVCLPQTIAKKRKVSTWINRMIHNGTH